MSGKKAPKCKHAENAVLAEAIPHGIGKPVCKTAFKVYISLFFQKYLKENDKLHHSYPKCHDYDSIYIEDDNLVKKVQT